MIISAARNGQISPDLPGVIYSLGRDAENEEEYEYAFRMLTSLSTQESANVLSMIILAFSLLAIYHGRLDRTIAEPVIKRAWQTAEGADRARIQDAVDDINTSLKWNLIL